MAPPGAAHVHHPAGGGFRAVARRRQLVLDVGDAAGDEFLRRRAEVRPPPDEPVIESVQVQRSAEHDEDVGLAAGDRLVQPPRRGDVHRTPYLVQHDAVPGGEQLRCADARQHVIVGRQPCREL
jgi:hypothetical protein